MTWLSGHRLGILLFPDSVLINEAQALDSFCTLHYKYIWLIPLTKI